MILWAQHHWTLSVWCALTNGIVLYLEIHHRPCIPCCEFSYHHSHHYVHPWVLHSGAHSCVSRFFFSWVAKGFLYLWISLSCGVSILWNHSGDVWGLTSGKSAPMHKIITPMYSIVTPVLNPLFYSLHKGTSNLSSIRSLVEWELSKPHEQVLWNPLTLPASGRIIF